MARIVIVGGGFAGLFTALNLEEYPWEDGPPEVLLLDSTDRFVFAPLLYELVSGELKTWEVAPRFVDLLDGRQIQFRQATVAGIDLSNGKVQLDDGSALPYDRLVLAAGGRTPLEIVPGAREHALPFRTLDDAHRLISRLKALLEAGSDPVRVALVGAGASGVELACKLADTLQEKGSVVLYDREKEILPACDEPSRVYVRSELERRAVRLGLGVKIRSIGEEGLDIETGEGRIERVPADIVLWTVGTAAPKLLENLKIPTTGAGRIKVEPTLQLSGHPEVFALGDLAEAVDSQGRSIDPSAQLAFQQAQFCAWNLWALAHDRPVLDFRYTSLGSILGLGTDGGLASLFGLRFSGSVGYLVRRLVYLYRMPTPEHRLQVALNWFASPLVRLLEG